MEKRYVAIEEGLLNKMLQVISDMPYRISHVLMKEIEKTEFKQVILQNQENKE